MHFTSRSGYKVNASPWGITPQFNAIFIHCFLHCLDMIPQIIDSVIIMNGTICFHIILCTKPVFHNHQRFLITIIHIVQCKSESCWINLPSPVTRFQIWIADTKQHVTTLICQYFRISRSTACHIIGEGNEINSSFSQCFTVFFTQFKHDSILLIFLQLISWIIAPCLYITVEIAVIH